jgi:hypothetical protein
LVLRAVTVTVSVAPEFSIILAGNRWVLKIILIRSYFLIDRA